MTRCLVTGATGFLGPHVVRALLAAGVEVISLSRTRVAPLAPLHRHIAVDLHDAAAVDEAINGAGASHLVHLAWEATPGVFWHSTENFRWIAASAFLLDAFLRAGGRRAVLAGSCAEYKPSDAPLLEASPTEGATFYAASKLAFHGLAETIAREIEMVWARIFFPYGPDEDASKLTSYIMRELSSGRAPVFQAPGRAVDMIHVEDVARAFACLVAADITGTVNIASNIARLPGEIALEGARLLGNAALADTLARTLRATPRTATLQGDNSRLLGVWSGAPMRDLKGGLASYLG